MFTGVSAHHFGTHAETHFERFRQIDIPADPRAFRFLRQFESAIGPFVIQILEEAEVNNIRLIRQVLLVP